MSDEKHTPGPWRVDTTKALGAYGVWTECGTHKGDDGGMYPSQICSVFESARGLGAIAIEEKNANAQLIAAAPTMYEALEKSEGALCMLIGDMRDRGFRLTEAVLQEILDRNRAAIARAETNPFTEHHNA